MDADQNLFDVAVSQLQRRWPDAPEAVAATVYLEDGSVLTGVSLDNFSNAMSLCAEIGPICEAYSLDRRIVASICVSRETGCDGFTVLAPCGACQERLALSGRNTEVGLFDLSSASGWSSRPLGELNPHYWAASFTDDGSSAPGRRERARTHAA